MPSAENLSHYPLQPYIESSNGREYPSEYSAKMYFLVYLIKKATKQYTNEKQWKQQNI
nr:hypothetical protein [uncultured Capnocytophaga sp.]